MGNFCPIFRRNQKIQYPTSNQPPPTTQRKFHKSQQPSPQIQQTLQLNSFNDQDRKSQDFVNVTNKYLPSFHKQSTKGLSTGIGSSLNQNKSTGSSLNFQTNFNLSSMIIISTNDTFPSSSFQSDDFYTLIDGISYVRKTSQHFNIQTPSEKIQVQCQAFNIMNTLFLASGIPIDQINMVAMNKIVQVQKSPIQIKLYIKCKNCSHQLKKSYSIAIVQISKIKCDECQKQGSWSLIKYKSNFPLWQQSKKLKQNEKLQTCPVFMRALGCIHCFRFTQCQKMACNCLICLPCKVQRQQKSQLIECHFCQKSKILSID